jgi:hypothetical protein
MIQFELHIGLLRFGARSAWAAAPFWCLSGSVKLFTTVITLIFDPNNGPS